MVGTEDPERRKGDSSERIDEAIRHSIDHAIGDAPPGEVNQPPPTIKLKTGDEDPPS